MSPPKLIEDYLAALPEIRAQRGRLLHTLVLKLHPHAVVSLDYRMPTYRLGEDFFAWANKKQYLSLYTCSAERIAAFRRKRPEIKSGGGCVNARDQDTFIASELRLLINDSLAPSAAIRAREHAALLRTQRGLKHKSLI